MKKLKMNRFFGLVLALVLALTSVPLTGLAEQDETEKTVSVVTDSVEQDAVDEAAVLSEDGIVASGTCGENLTWELNSEGTLTISGSGVMDDYGYYLDLDTGIGVTTSPWYSYRNSIFTVIIEDGVTTIGQCAFGVCEYLTSVNISESVSYIKESAFFQCTKLQQITIPSGVTRIDPSVFRECSKLTEIFVDSDNSAFISEDGVLYNKDKTRLICYPGGKQGNLVIPDSVISIDNDAAAFCKGLNSVTVGKNVSKIGSYVFAQCAGLSKVYFKGNAPTFGNYVFTGNTLTVYYPLGDDTWTDSIKKNASAGGTITWEKWNPETIDDSQDNSSITFDQGYTCEVGKSISISATYISEDEPTNIIWKCSDENAVTFSGTSVQGPSVTGEENTWWVSTMVTGVAAGSYDVTVSVEDISATTKLSIQNKTGSCGENLTWLLEDGVLTISGTGEMYDYGSENPPWTEYINEINAIIIEDGVTSVGDYAFWDCENASSVTLVDSVVDIGEFSFSMCYGLNSIIIPINVTSIGMDAFSNCTDLSEIYFKGSAPTFGTDVFIGVTSTAYYPVDDLSWSKDIRQNYGGVITWFPWNSETDELISLALTLDQVWGFKQSTIDELELKHYWKFFPYPGFADLLLSQDDGSSGLCSGMVTSVISISGYDTPPAESFIIDGDTHAMTLHDIMSPNSQSEVNEMTAADYVKYAYVYQSTIPVILEQKVNKNKLDKLYNAIQSSILENDEYVEIRIRGIYHGSNEGHVLLAMGIGTNNEEQTEIFVYDGNYPNKLQRLYLNKSNGLYTSWEYNVPGFLDWGTGKSGAEITYTTSGKSFANDMFSTYVENGQLENYKFLLSVKNRDLSLTTSDEKKQNLSEDTDDNVLLIEPGSISVESNESVSENKTLYWIGQTGETGELKCENGNNENEIEIASNNKAIRSVIPSISTFVVNVSDSENSYANIQDMPDNASFEIDYVFYDDNASKETISIKGVASNNVETRELDDSSITIEGAESLQIEMINNDADHSNTIEVNASNQAVNISQETDGALTVRMDTNGDGVYDKDVTNEETPNIININSCILTLSEAEYTYDGTEKEPTVTITNGDQVLKEGTDYTVTYSNNVNAGTASVSATGKENYTGTITKTFTIKKADQEIRATISSANLVEKETATIEVNAATGALSYSSSDTAVATVDENGVVTAVSIGTATITITAEGNENYNPATTAIEITVTEKPQQHTHEYGDPVFEWAEDHTCKAIFTCNDKDDEQTLDCTVTSKVIDPTCTKDGKTVYTATVEFDGKIYTDIKTVPGDPATGHSYEYTDNGDGTHTATCVNGDDSFTEDHVFKDGVCICGAKESESPSEPESPAEPESPEESESSEDSKPAEIVKPWWKAWLEKWFGDIIKPDEPTETPSESESATEPEKPSESESSSEPEHPSESPTDPEQPSESESENQKPGFNFWEWLFSWLFG